MSEIRKRKGDNTTKKGKETNVVSEKKKQEYSGSLFQRGLAYLFEKDDAAYLAVFRILWGSIMTYEAMTYMFYDFGKMYGSFYSSVLQFKYYGFEWCVVPEDPFIMKLIIVAMFISGICLTLGFFYRFSSIMFFLLFGYMYMLEQAMYLNHFYLVCVLSFMMIILPCNCLFSLDSLLWPETVYSNTCPKWCLIVVRTELAVVYTYAGICKINEDWLRGEPLRVWLANRQDTPYIGWILVKESTAYFMSYGGLIYDLIIAELLLFKKTLPIGIVLTMFFHSANKIVFNIGIFPYMMMASTTFFFQPDWPRRVYHMILGTLKTYNPLKTKSFSETAPRSLKIWEWLIILGLFLFLAHQILIPLRLHAYPGTVAWNESGHKFSWRMKLRTKHCDGHALAYHPDTHMAFEIKLSDYLNRRQNRKYASRPDMIIQMAHFLRDEFDTRLLQQSNITRGHEVYIESWCQLNGRPYQQFTNSTHDLAKSDKWALPYEWVTEIEPLSDELKQNYPWNFEWNFNWLKGIDRVPPNPRINNGPRGDLMRKEAWEKWQKWLLERDPDVQFIDSSVKLK